MITVLSEKEGQAILYYEGLTDKKVTPEMKKLAMIKGYLELQATYLFGGELVRITWSNGHQLELKEPEDYKEEWKEWSFNTLPIIPDHFEYKEKVQKNKKRKKDQSILAQFGKAPKTQLGKIKDCLKNARMIIWAGDIDREGSYISYIICKSADVWDKGKIFKSLWIDDPSSPDVVKKGFKNLQDIELRYNQALEAQARAYSDWLLGMNASRLLSLLLQKHLKLDLSNTNYKIAVGRILSPTAFFIYKREKERENFKPKTYYKLEGVFQHSNGIYKGKYIPAEVNYTKGKRKGEKWAGDCETKEQWEKLITNPKIVGDTSMGEISEYIVDLKSSQSPKLFSLNDLQKYMSRLVDLDPSKTLEIVQELYEKDQLVTYPRTSSNHITKEKFTSLAQMIEEMREWLEFSDDFSIPDKKDISFVNNKKAALHAALTPTKHLASKEEYQSWNENKKIIYLEILKRTFAMFLPRYQYEQTTIITQVGAALFKTTGKVPKQEGWKKLWQGGELIDPEELEPERLISVAKGDRVIPELSISEKKTSIPPLYTPGTLLAEMETAGRFIEDDELREIMKETQGLGTEATRASIIDKIFQYGWATKKKGKIYLQPIGKIICQSIEGERLLSDPLTTALWEQSLRKIGQKENTKKAYLANIKRYLDIENKENNLFNNLSKWVSSVDYSLYNEWLQKTEEQNNGIIGKCPKCQGKVKYFVSSKSQKAFIACENNNISLEDQKLGKEPSCDFFVGMTIAKKTLSLNTAKKLLTNKETDLLKGFSKRSGDKFEAKIGLKQNRETNRYETSFLNER
ncbi:TPA: DNA topoisomerase [Streptococcus agalactiae]|nr:topoisomerase C-terminal repeat-containing protein [Streptococcus agalactiae]